jgi:hypothetical protein
MTDMSVCRSVWVVLIMGSGVLAFGVDASADTPMMTSGPDPDDTPIEPSKLAAKPYWHRLGLDQKPPVFEGMGRRHYGLDALLRASGGNTESEAAIARGLVWLSRTQREDGGWGFGNGRDSTVAATGMALLPFLGAGQIHVVNDRRITRQVYLKTVRTGLDFLLSHQQEDGVFRDADMTNHALATLALCEAYGMTLDPKLRDPARRALKFIAASSHVNGGWGAAPGRTGGMAETAWQVQALTAGQLAGLPVPDAAFLSASKFFHAMASEDGSAYSPRAGVKPTVASTAAGLYCRQLLGTWPDDLKIAKGLDRLAADARPTAVNFDLPTSYLATQALFHTGGPRWDDGKGGGWNPSARDTLVRAQVRVKAPEEGSWPSTDLVGGRHAATCLAVLTLETYYRYLPITPRNTGEVKELER